MDADEDRGEHLPAHTHTHPPPPHLLFKEQRSRRARHSGAEQLTAMSRPAAPDGVSTCGYFIFHSVKTSAEGAEVVLLNSFASIKSDV